MDGNQRCTWCCVRQIAHLFGPALSQLLTCQDVLEEVKGLAARGADKADVVLIQDVHKGEEAVRLVAVGGCEDGNAA